MNDEQYYAIFGIEIHPDQILDKIRYSGCDHEKDLSLKFCPNCGNKIEDKWQYKEFVVEKFKSRNPKYYVGSFEVIHNTYKEVSPRVRFWLSVRHPEDFLNLTNNDVHAAIEELRDIYKQNNLELDESKIGMYRIKTYYHIF